MADKFIGETSGKYWKQKNDETYVKETELAKITDLEESETVEDDDLLIKGNSSTGTMLRIKIANFLDGIKSKLLGTTDISSIGDGTVTGAISKNANDISGKADTTALTDGSVTKVGTASVGSGTKPMYLNSGTPTASSSTVGSSAIPVYMNSGTVTACDYSLAELNSALAALPVIETGSVTFSDLATNTYTDTAVTFSKSFSSTPNIVMSFSNSTTGSSSYVNLALTTVNRSRTGFTLRILNNNSASGLNPQVHWVAVGS